MQEYLRLANSKAISKIQSIQNPYGLLNRIYEVGLAEMSHREDIGLQAVFNKVFPITDFSGVAELRFVKYELEDPKYDVEECIQRGGTYGSLLKVTLNLIIREIDEETGVSSVKDIKELKFPNKNEQKCVKEFFINRLDRHLFLLNS